MSVPNSRPIHPCYMPSWEDNPGAEYSVWANITKNEPHLPNLVTAEGSSITIYSIDDATGKLILEHRFPGLAGNVCFLGALHVDDGPDSLLVGFAGDPRISVVSISTASDTDTRSSTQSLYHPSDLLLTTSLVDLKPAIEEHSYGSVTPLEVDLTAQMLQKKNIATVSAILGGGVLVVCIKLRHTCSGWITEEPYMLPLKDLSRSVYGESSHDAASLVAAAMNNLGQSISTGFGDILETTFLTGYLEPTVLFLHSKAACGQMCTNRLGRPEGAGGTRYGLVLTAISVTVSHQQSAVLWSTEVPADALSIHSVGKKGCLVQCANSVVSIDSTGQIRQCLAVNGWVKSTLPVQMLERVQTNPWPFPKLAIQLDGAKFSVVSDSFVFVTLREGQIYFLQHSGSWCMLPLHRAVGAVGQVSNLLCLPFGSAPRNVDKLLLDGKKKGEMEMGLLFAGSRLGDSSLFGFTLENVSIDHVIASAKGEPGGSNPDDQFASDNEGGDEILRLEEEALYAPYQDDTGESTPNIIPPSDDEETIQNAPEGTSRKRARLSHLQTVRSLTVLDSMTALGPLGPGCEGPLSKPPAGAQPGQAEKGVIFGSTAQVVPCGYGSSGGLAIMTIPGRDDRCVLAEEDCVNVQSIINLSQRGLIMLCSSPSDGGARFLELNTKNGEDSVSEENRTNNEGGIVLQEIDPNSWFSTANDHKIFDLFARANVLDAAEFDKSSFVVFVAFEGEKRDVSYVIAELSDAAGTLDVTNHTALSIPEDDNILSVNRPVTLSPTTIVFGCVLASGDAKIVTVNRGDTSEVVNLFASNMDIEEELNEEEMYYKSDAVVAIDFFECPVQIFRSDEYEQPEPNDGESSSDEKETGSFDADFDDEDIDLYRNEDENSRRGDVDQQGPDSYEGTNIQTLVGICRQSGVLEVYILADLLKGEIPLPIWSGSGCGHGVPIIGDPNNDGSTHRAPRMHKVCARELKFFFSGPSDGVGPNLRTFCLGLMTNDGDFHLYSAHPRSSHSGKTQFSRVPLNTVSRPSKEQARHFAKLRRKGIVATSNSMIAEPNYQRNRLFPFIRLSGTDGLFAATARPFWILSERGKPTMLSHRSRHVAPSGGKPRPVVSFVPGILNNGPESDAGYMTLHERVGRIGSQRLTIFSSILKGATQTLLPGGGMFIEKVPMGVTVRRIQFINGPKELSGSHPLYAVLVSREMESDQSGLNDDGLSEEERQQIREEKESAKIKRQVEADLGGFDIEQEWVEEIEREDCFKVDTSLGGAPPIQKRAYSLWIVDASDKWNVVDSYEFEENEHGMTMEVMTLTEFEVEPGSSSLSDIPSPESMNTRLFITIGTGIVDKNGEDVSSKGRILMFQVNRADEAAKLATSQIAELSMVYEKVIYHGPVTSLSCLSDQGLHRIVVGAGSDVNVEQWGNEKLTQVGFFRATMHILDIKLFKSFFILSDAYDSIYFLVWRESDKSLTLLAKDYDPVPVYASGLLSRGGSLSLVCHDDRQNLQFFQYAPGDPAARGGNKLVCRADFHLGSQTVAMQNHYCRSSLLINSATPQSTLAALKQQDSLFGRSDDDQRIGVHFGTTDGGQGTMIPLSEPVYWRLTALQSVMANAIESNCALNPRAWRMYRRTARRGGCRNSDRKKGVIDGELIQQYVDLSLFDQEDLASAIGSSVELILDNILELKCCSMIN